MTCPKCGSENVNVQREQTATIGGSTHKVQQKKQKAAFIGVDLASLSLPLSLSFMFVLSDFLESVKIQSLLAKL